MTGPWISQTDARRVVVEGRLIPAGGACTVMFITAPGGWVLHPFGLNLGAVGLTWADAKVISDGLRAA